VQYKAQNVKKMNNLTLIKRLRMVFKDNGYEDSKIYYNSEQHIIYSSDSKYIFDTIYSMFVFCGVADEYDYFLVSNRMFIDKKEITRVQEYFNFKEKAINIINSIPIAKFKDDLYKITEQYELPNGRMSYKGYYLYKEKNWAGQINGIIVTTENFAPIFYYRNNLISIPPSICLSKQKPTDMLLNYNFNNMSLNKMQPKITLMPPNLVLYDFYLKKYPEINIFCKKGTTILETINYTATKSLLKTNKQINYQQAFEWFLSLKINNKKGKTDIENFINSITSGDIKSRVVAAKFPDFKRKVFNLLLTNKKTESFKNTETSISEEEFNNVKKWFNILFTIKKINHNIYILFDNIPYEIKLDKKTYKDITRNIVAFLSIHKSFVGVFPYIEDNKYIPIFTKYIENILLEILDKKNFVSIQNNKDVLKVFGGNGSINVLKKEAKIVFKKHIYIEESTLIIKDFNVLYSKLNPYKRFYAIEKEIFKIIDYKEKDRKVSARKFLKYLISAPIKEMFDLDFELKVNYRRKGMEMFFQEIMKNNPFVVINKFPIRYNKSVKEDTLIFKDKIKPDGNIVKRLKFLYTKEYFDTLFRSLLYFTAIRLNKESNPDGDTVIKAIDGGWYDLLNSYKPVSELTKKYKQ